MFWQPRRKIVLTTTMIILQVEFRKMLECETGFQKWIHNASRMWNMISSPATPAVCLEQKSENFQSRNVMLSMLSPSQQIIVFEMICNADYYSAAKFTFPIEQPSNEATKGDIMRSWKLKVKPNHGCCSYIAITISYISVFVSSW